MIRAFPRGFNYTIPRGFPWGRDASDANCPGWDDSSSDSDHWSDWSDDYKTSKEYAHANGRINSSCDGDNSRDNGNNMDEQFDRDGNAVRGDDAARGNDGDGDGGGGSGEDDRVDGQDSTSGEDTGREEGFEWHLSEFGRNAWHAQGFRVVMRVLASNKDLGKVSEVCIDANGLETGLNYRLFKAPCQVLEDFKTVLARPGLRHLQLDLRANSNRDHEAGFKTGLLRRALSKGGSLEHLSIRTNVQMTIEEPNDHLYIPIRTVLPSLRGLPNLRHLGISRIHVRQTELLEFLAELPPSLESLELSAICFVKELIPVHKEDPQRGCAREFLQDMRDTLGWQERIPKLKVRMGIRLNCWIIKHQTLWFDEDLDEFLYRGGDNPFGKEREQWPNDIRMGFSTWRDSFDPLHT